MSRRISSILRARVSVPTVLLFALVLASLARATAVIATSGTPNVATPGTPNVYTSDGRVSAVKFVALFDGAAEDMLNSAGRAAIAETKKRHGAPMSREQLAQAIEKAMPGIGEVSTDAKRYGWYDAPREQLYVVFAGTDGGDGVPLYGTQPGDFMLSYGSTADGVCTYSYDTSKQSAEREQQSCTHTHGKVLG